MTGRHGQTSTPGRAGRSTLGLIVIVLVVAFLVGGTLYLAHAKPATKRAAAIVASLACNGPSLTLVVDVAPTLAIPVNQIAHDWAGTNPRAGGKCVQVELASDTVDQQESRLSSQSGADTDIWLPDSTMWAQRLSADENAASGSKAVLSVHPSLASSPLVAVAAPERAAKLAAQVANPDFDPFAAAVIAGPMQNAEGLLVLLTVDGQLAGSSGAADPTVPTGLLARMRALSHTSLNSVADGFNRLATDPARAPTFVASEQAVIAANASHGSVFATAVYPIAPTLSLNFPVIRLTRAADDPALASAADQFEKALRQPSAKARFSALGLRGADGTPVPGTGTAQGVLPDLVPAATAPAADQTMNLIRLWHAAGSDNRTLAVIDVSGSMAEPAGNGQTKITTAAAAAREAISFFPDSSALGLWAFSSDQSANTPWVQLVPLGLLSDRVGSGSRRQALVAAAATMPARVHGGTALYDTVLAAYLQVQRGYDPSKVNTVVLMTDGQNDLTGGLSLDGLLAALHGQADPARPVQVITIGIGAADGAALARISAATAGRFYPVKFAKDISGVFLDAVAQLRCQRSC